MRAFFTLPYQPYTAVAEEEEEEKQVDEKKELLSLWPPSQVLHRNFFACTEREYWSIEQKYFVAKYFASYFAAFFSPLPKLNSNSKGLNNFLNVANFFPF